MLTPWATLPALFVLSGGGGRVCFESPAIRSGLEATMGTAGEGFCAPRLPPTYSEAATPLLEKKGCCCPSEADSAPFLFAVALSLASCAARASKAWAGASASLTDSFSSSASGPTHSSQYVTGKRPMTPFLSPFHHPLSCS